MKVLYLVTDDWYFLSHRLHLARAVRERGCEVVVVTAPGSRTSEIEREGFRHRPLRFHRTVSSQPGNLAVLHRLTKIYRQERPDLVHHVSFLPVVLGSLAARRARVPAVVNAVTGLGHAFIGDSLRDRILRGAMERAYGLALARRGTLTIFQNDEDRRFFLTRGLVAASDSVCVAGSGVDTERFEAHPEPEDNPEPIVLHASRMLWSKGVADTVEACRLLRRRGIGHRLVLAGRTHASNPESIPETQLRAWQEEGAADWIGHHEDMPGLLARAHVVCLPSVYREGVPLVLLEAASAGRPIVTTDVPGCRDIVADGENGLVVPVRDARRLADALETLLATPSLRASMGRAGRQRVLAGFSKEIVLQRTLEGYRSLLPELGPPRVETETRRDSDDEAVPALHGVHDDAQDARSRTSYA